MNYTPTIVAFFIGMIISFVITSEMKTETLIGEVTAQTGEMEAVWYPQSE